MAMIDLIVQALALSRLLRLFTEEDGPYNIMGRFRQAIGIDAYGGHDEDNQLAGLFACSSCLGIWIAPVIFITYRYLPWAVHILAIAALGGLLNALADKLMYE